jgi:hypothetical protein
MGDLLRWDWSPDSTESSIPWHADRHRSGLDY